MKKVLVLLALICLVGYSTEAQIQKGNSFILGNVTNHIKANNYNANTPFGNLVHQTNGGALYVKAISTNKAMRYGIGVGTRTTNFSAKNYVRRDTVFNTSIYNRSSVPRLILGKEWQKNIHSDVMIIGGADITAGGGANHEEETTSASFENGRELYINKATKGGFALYSGFTPFTGIRVCWGRLALGYSITMPIEIDAVFNESNFFNWETNFAHNLSVGIRFSTQESSRTVF